MEKNFYENLKNDDYFKKIINGEIKEPLEDCEQLEYEILEEKHNDICRDKLMLLRFYKESIVRFYKISDEEMKEVRDAARKKYLQDAKSQEIENSSKGK